jgi:hypothetical protein
MSRRRSFRSLHGLPRRSNRNPPAYLRRSDLLRIHLNRDFRHWLRAGETILRNRHHRALHATIRISNIGYVRGVVYDRRVIDIRDHGGADDGIADIDAGHVSGADVVRRHPYFARTEREPSNISAPAAARANEHNQRWRVHGLYGHRPRYPSPASADRSPAAVMERCVAPR